MKRFALPLFTLILMPLFSVAQTFVYFGTTTQNTSQGIYRSELDMETGLLSKPVLAAEALDPEFIVVNKAGDRLYCIRQFLDESGQKRGGVSAYSIERDGSLTLINHQYSNTGRSCHVALDQTDKILFTANYGKGIVESYPILDDGSIGPIATSIQHEGSSVNPSRQSSPHAHSVNSDPQNRWAYAADLGMDQIRIYDLDTKNGTLSANSVAFSQTELGGGPRHMDFHPNGKFAYANLELTSRVTAFRIDPDSGALSSLQTLSTLPDNTIAENNSTAETLVHPNGRFLYVSNRGHDSIAIFAIDPSSGLLEFQGTESTRGSTPRNFGIDPSGKFLIASNQRSADQYVFRIDPESGLLDWTGSKTEVDHCICVRFVTR